MSHERIGLQYILPSKEMIEAARQAHEIAKVRTRLNKLFGVVGTVVNSYNADIYGFTAAFHQSGGKAIRRAFVCFDELNNCLLFWPKKGDRMADRALAIVGEEDEGMVSTQQGDFYEVNMTAVNPIATLLEFPTRRTATDEVDRIYSTANRAAVCFGVENIPARELNIVEASRIIGVVSDSKVVNF